MAAARDTSRGEPARFIDLFAGIGGMRIPFDELGYRCVFSSEVDASARRTYEAWFGERPAGDITQIDVDDIPAHDLLVAGFPCQAFSIMGKGLGFADTRGTLFFEIERILRRHRPAMLLLENVKQLRTHDGGRTLSVIVETLGDVGYAVDWRVLNALDFGLPQKRERVLIVAFLDVDVLRKFEWPMGERGYDLANVLEPDARVEARYFASDHIVARRRERVEGKAVFYPSVWHENKSGNISVLDHSCALRTGASYNYLIVNGVRRPTPRELLRLQGFPDRLPIVVSYHEVRRQTGNAVPVSMIRAIAQAMDAARTQIVGPVARR
jgi:DNA (cytosine-5)-methyltransferase 1